MKINTMLKYGKDDFPISFAHYLFKSTNLSPEFLKMYSCGLALRLDTRVISLLETSLKLGIFIGEIYFILLYSVIVKRG